MANNTGRRRLRNLNFYGYSDRPEMDGTDVFGELRKQQLINIGQQLEIDDLYVTIQVDSGNTNYMVYQGPNLIGEIKVDTVVRRAWYDPTQHALILVIGSEGGEEKKLLYLLTYQLTIQRKKDRMHTQRHSVPTIHKELLEKQVIISP